MAINISDFNKIWASTSPLTPYSFTDANYQQGWNFVGSTPPARQMWDSYMKFSDEKQQYIVNNFLPLSGGTMTGDIVRTSGSLAVASADDGYIQLYGGTGYDHGAWLQLCGKDNSNTGRWSLQANNGTNKAALTGDANGTLTWGGNTIPTKNVNIQTGKTASTSVPAGDSVAIAITFSPAFSSNPVVLATVQTNYKGLYASVGSVSTSSASITLNNASGTERSVVVGWMAISI